jgi:hypothetical protein
MGNSKVFTQMVYTNKRLFYSTGIRSLSVIVHFNKILYQVKTFFPYIFFSGAAAFWRTVKPSQCRHGRMGAGGREGRCVGHARLPAERGRQVSHAPRGYARGNRVE